MLKDLLPGYYLKNKNFKNGLMKGIKILLKKKKEKKQKYGCKQYRKLPEKEKKATILPRKIKKQQYCRERYKNIPEDEKKKKKKKQVN